MKTITCCICNANINEAESHNPWPVRTHSSIGEEENRCCQVCNDTIVIPARIACINATREQMEIIHENFKNMDYQQLMKVINGLNV